MRSVANTEDDLELDADTEGIEGVVGTASLEQKCVDSCAAGFCGTQGLSTKIRLVPLFLEEPRGPDRRSVLMMPGASVVQRAGCEVSKQYYLEETEFIKVGSF